VIEGYEWVGWLLFFAGLFGLAICISWTIDWIRGKVNSGD
jgi:hypothetical protein